MQGYECIGAWMLALAAALFYSALHWGRRRRAYVLRRDRARLKKILAEEVEAGRPV